MKIDLARSGSTSRDPVEPAPTFTRLAVIETTGFADYALLDSGGGRKLERFGAVVVDRPEPQALWRPCLQKLDWTGAHAVYSASDEDEEKGKWRVDKPIPDSWPVRIVPTLTAVASASRPHARGPAAASPQGQVTMLCRLQGLWHLGLFPEQLPLWEWMLARLAGIEGEQPRVLNLFAYTGAASLLAAAHGAHVTHVDASKKAIEWAKENQAASGLEGAPIRWLLDDARKFVAREVRRGKTYHVILIDPPKFGRGPEGEVWELFADLPKLLADCVRLLAPRQAAMVLTTYAIRASVLAFDQLMRDVLAGRAGAVESGELVIRAAGGGRVVPAALFAGWTSDDWVAASTASSGRTLE
jgi:23S rRNA (cytosine1962-C5)-methyltransferase